MSARGYSKEILHPFNHGFYGSPDPADQVASSDEIIVTESQRVYEYKYDEDSFAMDDFAMVGETEFDPDDDRFGISESSRVFIQHYVSDSVGLDDSHAWSFTPQYSTDYISFDDVAEVDDIQLVFIEGVEVEESSTVGADVKSTDQMTFQESHRIYTWHESSDSFELDEDWTPPSANRRSMDTTSFVESQSTSASVGSTDSLSAVDGSKPLMAFYQSDDRFTYTENQLTILYKYSGDSFSAEDSENFYLAPHPHRLVLGGNVVLGQWISGDNIDTDVSGWANHADLEGVHYVRPLEVGGYHSLHFQSGASFEIVPEAPLDAYQARFTVSLWFRAEVDGTLAHAKGMWSIGIEGQSIVASITDRFGNTRSGLLVDRIEYGRSYHLGVVFAGDINTAYSYLNGQGRDSFSIEGIKKLEAPEDGVIELGVGPQGRFAGEIDNFHILAGSVPPDEVYAYYEKATRTQDFLESVQAQRPLLILSYDASDEDQDIYFDPLDLAMTKFLINDDNFEETSHSWHPIIWTEEYFDGVQLEHTGYLTLDLKPEDEVEHKDFIPSIEFVVDDMLNAEGVIFDINFQGDDRFRARAEDGLLIVEEFNALGVFWFIEIKASERMHCIINMDEDDVYIYVNGYVRASLSPQNRTPFESIRMLGDGNDPFTGIAGPIIIYEEPVHRFVITQHFDIAYGGNTAVQYTETSTVIVNDDEYDTLMYDWTMVPA